MSNSKQILTEEMSEEQVRQIIRTELARVFFDLYRKRSTWEKA
jgi:hypothetical protein|tara:strand:- start:633 stop:761 length:129 start_codon:yes stop_codon:yes gene_type:complete